MSPSNDEELVPPGSTVADVQKGASASLCFVAAGMAAYTAAHGVWLLATPFLVGLVLAVQSYRVAAETEPAIKVASVER